MISRKVSDLKAEALESRVAPTVIYSDPGNSDGHRNKRWQKIPTETPEILPTTSPDPTPPMEDVIL